MASLLRAFMRQQVAKPDNVPEPDFNALVNSTHFTKRELRKLFTRFCLLCNTESGLIERLPCVQQAELAYCPLISLAFEHECRQQKKDRVLQAMAFGTENTARPESIQVVKEEKGDDVHIDIYAAGPGEKSDEIGRPDSPCSGDEQGDDDSSSEDPSLSNRGPAVKQTPTSNDDPAAEGLDFTHFVKLLSEFSPKASLTQKASYFFMLMKDDDSDVITRDGYLTYLKKVTNGVVPAYIYEDEVIQDLWSEVAACCESDVITRRDFSKFISTIELHLFMTVNY